jgi:sugar lactone lactonase YvrE
MTRTHHFPRIAAGLFAALVLLSAARPAQAGDEPLNRSSIAFTLAEKDLLPESVAYDPKTKAFFVSSTRKGKIVRYQDGKASDFVGPRQHGLYMTIGMKADPKRRVLWVASTYGSNLETYEKRDGSPAALFKFDLDTAALLGKWDIGSDGATHFLNDLALAPDGSVFVTHMFDAAQVWRLDAATGTFAPWYRGDPAFKYPNGIACDAACTRLYVAHEGGISMIDVATRERVLLTAPEGQPISGNDGLYLHQGDLVGVQPGRKRVMRFSLSADGRAVTESKVLEYKHPLFDDPTTGVIVGEYLYYIANAQFDRFDKDGKLFPMERLYQPVILKVAL